MRSSNPLCELHAAARMMSKRVVVSTLLGPATLRRSKRKTLAISVHPDGSLDLTAPMGARVGEILAKVSKRAAWIRRQRREFAVMNARESHRRYCSGATHRYLGRQYRLKVTRGSSAEVTLRGAFLHVITRNGTEAEVEEQLTVWMRKRAQQQFQRRLKQWSEWCRRYRLAVPRIQVRKMAKRWGSAQRDGRIWFNPELVRAPAICIDYVVAHEVCHLRHPNHGRAFFQQLEQMFPGWREAKRRLEAAEL